MFLITRPLTVGVRAFATTQKITAFCWLNILMQMNGPFQGRRRSWRGSNRRSKAQLSEETGLECSLRQYSMYFTIILSKRDHVITYLVDNWQLGHTHKRPQLEISKTGWFTLDKVPRELAPCTEAALKFG